MKARKSDWYKNGWTLDIKEQSWTEHTKQQVNFIIKCLKLNGNEKILDLACGYGRHSLEFARRGYKVTGVDITTMYIEDAVKEAKSDGLDVEFICSDIREINFEKEFDVVLNLGDGAIGYLENESENLKIFDIIARALTKGGKSFIDIQSGDYADAHFPQKLWDAGDKTLTLSNFEWDTKTRIMLYSQLDYSYGKILKQPEIPYGNPTRLYTKEEIRQIMKDRGMELYVSYSDFYGLEANENGFQLMTCSVKK